MRLIPFKLNMLNNLKSLVIPIGLLVIVFAVILKTAFYPIKTKGTVVAIANYGPHITLDETIQGFKSEMSTLGYVENHNIHYVIKDVGFNAHLIPLMIDGILNNKPDVLVTLTTPIAQYAKSKKGSKVPIVFTAISDPIKAGVISVQDNASNAYGVSDKQNLDEMLNFASIILPHTKRIGLLYAVSESNDITLYEDLKSACHKKGFELHAFPVNSSADINTVAFNFKDKIDFLYVGTSGPIAPSLPIIASIMDKLKIPVISVDTKSVNENLVLASFGVNYEKVGANSACLVDKLLKSQNANSNSNTIVYEGVHICDQIVVGANNKNKNSKVIFPDLKSHAIGLNLKRYLDIYDKNHLNNVISSIDKLGLDAHMVGL